MSTDTSIENLVIPYIPAIIQSASSLCVDNEPETTFLFFTSGSKECFIEIFELLSVGLSIIFELLLAALNHRYFALETIVPIFAEMRKYKQ